MVAIQTILRTESPLGFCLDFILKQSFFILGDDELLLVCKQGESLGKYTRP